MSAATNAGAGPTSRLDLDTILDEARAATGLGDMGSPDIVPALRILLASLRDEAMLHRQGAETQRATILAVIVNRLRIADAFRRHPEIDAERIGGPIVITGLPRSGTTKLQRMMAADPGLQWLPLWRLMNPMPAGMAISGEADPRIAIAEQASARMREHHPDFYAGHPMNATEADEEMLMADLAMRGSYTCNALRVPSYDKWMRTQEQRSWYALLNRLLKLFQWQDGSSGRPWLLKSPAHLGDLAELFRTFPDATVVHCHRDPVTTTASIAKLAYAARRMYSDHDDRAEVGRFVLDWWSAKMRRCVGSRPALEGRHRFVDVSYDEITGDLMGAIARIYDAAGMTMTDTAGAAMAAWDAGNPPGKHGAHRYALDEAGLTETDVRAAYAPYLERFGGLT